MVDQLEEQQLRRPVAAQPTHHVRETVVALLLVVACLCATFGTVGLWAKRNFLDTARFVSRAAPLASDPDVQVALTDRLTTELMQVIDPRKLFAEALPDRGQILAIPLSSAVESFVHGRVLSFVGSDAFEKLWTAALRAAHGGAMRVLRGESTVVVGRNGAVVLDLVPMINAILGAIDAASPDVLGRDVTLPKIRPGQDPKPAVQRLAAALGVTLPQDYGQVQVYDRDYVSAAQEAVHLFDRFVVVIVVVAIGSALAALWITTRRLRTVLYLSGGLVAGMVLMRRASFRIIEDVTALPRKASGQRAAAVVVSAFLDPLTTFAAWATGVLLVVMLVAAVSSSHPRIVRFRRHVAGVGRSLWGKAPLVHGDRAAQADEAAVWASDHLDAVRWGGAAAGLLVLWLFDVSTIGIVVVVAAIALFEAGASRLAHSAPPR